MMLIFCFIIEFVIYEGIEKDVVVIEFGLYKVFF